MLVYKKLPLLVVLVSAFLALAFSSLIPYLGSGTAGSQPPFGIMLGAGLVVIALTAGILLLAVKFGLPLQKSTLGLVFAFNALIAIVKFVVAPLSLYHANQIQDFVTSSNVVTPGGYWAIAGVVLLLYALVLAVSFRMGVHTSGLNPRERRRHIWKYVVGLLIFIVAPSFLAGSIGLLALLPVYVPVFVLSDYLGNVGAGAFLIFGLLLAAVVLAFAAFHRAAGEAKLLRNAGLLASLFWLCLSLLVLYHVLWVVFMGALVTIWPFKTFSPNGK